MQRLVSEDKRISHFGMKDKSSLYPLKYRGHLSFRIFLYSFATPGPLLMKMTKTTSNQAARTAVVALQTTATALVVPAKVQQIKA